MGVRTLANRSKVVDVPEANRLLPLVSKWAARIDRRVALRNRLSDEMLVLQMVSDTYSNGRNPEFFEFLDKSVRYHRLGGQVDALVDRLSELGCVVRNRDARWLDFTFLRQDGIAVLCWDRSEESVTHWHFMHETHSMRRLLTPLDE